MGKRSKGKRPSKGQTVTSKKTKRPSAVVMWEDGTENLVFCHQLEAVDGASLPLAVGMSVKHFWRPEKKIYLGCIIELESDDTTRACTQGENDDTTTACTQEEKENDDTTRVCTQEEKENDDTTTVCTQEEKENDDTTRVCTQEETNEPRINSDMPPETNIEEVTSNEPRINSDMPPETNIEEVTSNEPGINSDMPQVSTQLALGDMVTVIEELEDRTASPVYSQEISTIDSSVLEVGSTVRYFWNEDSR